MGGGVGPRKGGGVGTREGRRGYYIGGGSRRGGGLI